MSDNTFKKFSVHQQLEHLHSKYTGCGGPDTRAWELQVTVHRDSIASAVGRIGGGGILALNAIGQGESVFRIRHELLQKMIEPCGPRPKEEEVR